MVPREREREKGMPVREEERENEERKVSNGVREYYSVQIHHLPFLGAFLSGVAFTALSVALTVCGISEAGEQVSAQALF